MTPRKNKRPKYDWPTIRHEYVTSPAGEGEVTLEMLCAKYKGHAALMRKLEDRSAKEGWRKLRAQHRHEVAEKGRKKDVETAAQRLHRHAQSAKFIQAEGLQAMKSKKIVPDAGKVIDAIKLERALYGEAGEVAQIEVTDRDRKMAAAYWKARRELAEEEGDGD